MAYSRRVDKSSDSDETDGVLQKRLAASPPAAELRLNPRPLLNASMVVAAYLFGFIVLDLISHQFEELGGIVAWYPPAGLTYTLLLVFGVRFTPAVTVALLFSSLFVYRMSQPPQLLFAWALVLSLVYGGSAALLVRRVRFDWRLRKLRDVTWFVLVTVLVSALLAVMSVSSSALTSPMPKSQVFRAIFDWWIGESVGVLTVTPFLLVYVFPLLKRFVEGRAARLTQRRVLPRPALSTIGQVASVGLTLYWVFGVRGAAEYHPLFLLSLPLIWIAMQHGLKGVSGAIFAVNSGVVIAARLSGLDPARLGELELLMIVNCVVGLLMGAVVTEGKRGEEALRESEERLREVLENSLDTPYKRNLRTNAYEYLSPVFVRISGYTSEEFRNLPAEADLDLIHPDDRAEVGRAVAESMAAADGAPNHVEYRFAHRDGKYRWFRDQFIITRDAQGQPAARIGSVSDVTERKLSEQEREKLQAQLVQSQKMEAVGRLAGGVAHDFNNMLTVILGETELALDQIDPTHPVHDDLQEVIKAAVRSTDLTRQLLAFSRKQTIAPRVLDLNETVDGMLKMLRRLIGEDIDLAWMPLPGLWPVKLDPSQVDQILANLCVNARDAIAGVGKVTIETGKAEIDEAYCDGHPGFVPGEYVVLAVSDDGCGMDKGALEHLFEPFFTTKEIGQGTGLGLATVYGIVSQNNGFVNVYSELGIGTTFRIYLPRHTEQAIETLPEPAAQTQPVSETILLVEDEPAILQIGRRLLQSAGYTVLAADSPGEAMRLAGEHLGEIHLLVTDVVMPGMSGRELAKHLQEGRPATRCLYMSGYTANVIAHRGVLDEGVHFIGKPFSAGDLAAKVREVLDRKPTNG
jgi:PAS domain S-box-containing protein